MNNPKEDAEFLEAFDRMANDLVYANIHFTLFLALNDSFRDYEREVRRSQVFWGLARDSLKDVAIMGLCRVYDQTRRANSLLNVLRMIDNDPNYLDDNAVRRDLEFTNAASNPAVQRLKDWRNKVLAHTDFELSLAGKKLAREKVPKYDDLKLLFRQGIKIVNRYAGWYWGQSYVDKLYVGGDDFNFVLESVKERIDKEWKELWTNI